MELLIRILMSSLAHNQTFNSAVLPTACRTRYLPATRPVCGTVNMWTMQSWGRSGPRLRSDVSMTLFLRDPESYQEANC